MAVSKEDLGNRALFLAGEKPFVRLTDRDHEGAIAINTIYEQIERETFEMPNNWNFATTRRQLAELADANGAIVPVCGWDHQYHLPANALRILALVDVNGDVIERRWRREVLQYTVSNRTVETDVILMNDDGTNAGPYVRFLLYREEPNKRHAWFNKLFCFDMALTIVKPISKEDPGKTTLERQRKLAYDDAVAANGMEGADVSIRGENIHHGHNLLEEVDGKQGSRVSERT